MRELNLEGSIAGSAHQSADQVLMLLESGMSGLTTAEAARRLVAVGPNAVRTHKASAWSVLGRELGSPILVLLFLTAGLSLVLGDATNSVVLLHRPLIESLLFSLAIAVGITPQLLPAVRGCGTS